MKKINVWKNPIHFLSLGFGLGLMPKAPGTWGTLAAIPIYLLFADAMYSTYLLMLVLVTLTAIWCAHYTSLAMGVHDHPSIVIDEVAGFLLTLFAVPFSWYWLLVGFILFRLFDIWKPWPIRLFDRKIHGGLGIVVDDLMAGFYAWVILQFIVWLVIPA